MNGQRGRQIGYVLVSVAFTLLVLSLFAALAVDMGVGLSARASAQRAADSAALAGAFTFVVNPSAVQPQTAQQAALGAALSNNIVDSAITAPEVTVNVDVANRLVTVDITHNQPAFFARVFGQNQLLIAVRGIAEASANATGSSCAKPWFISNTILSNLAPCDACAAGEVLIQNGAATPWALDPVRIGQQFTIKPNNPANALAPGQFYAIRMGDSKGGNDYRTNIATCSPDIVYCQAAYGVEPGNMIGPTVQGVRALTGPNPDTFVAMGLYQRSGGMMSDTSPQLIVAPVWDECNMAGFCPTGELPGGGSGIQIRVVGFALIFLEGVAGGNVIARFLGASACGAGGGGGGGGGGGPAPPETGPFGIPVRLVRVP